MAAWKSTPTNYAPSLSAASPNIHEQLRRGRPRASAFGFSSFWHNMLGVDAQGRPSTAIIHPFDTRSDGAAKKLAARN